MTNINNLIKLLKTNDNDNNDNILIELINLAKDEKDLVGIGLALRYGADPNIYINEKHILIYLNTINDKDELVLNSIILLLLISGSDLNLNENINIDNVSVIEWMRENNGNNIFELMYNISLPYNNIDSVFMTKLAILLDLPEYIVSTPSLSEIIRDHSMKCLNLKLNSNINLSPEDLNLSLKYVNNESYKNMMDKGCIPSYLTVNNLILLFKFFNNDESNNNVSLNNIKDMLEYTVSSGVKIDPYQFEIIRATDYIFSNNIITKYQISYTIDPLSLKNIANTHHINIDKTSNIDTNTQILNALRIISKTDPIKIKKSAINRQIIRNNPNIHSITDLISSRTSNDDNNIFNNSEYNDIDLSYYIENGITWCFTSDMLDSILKTRINPYTKQKLPDEYIKKLQGQRSLLKRLGFTTSYIDKNVETTYEVINFIYSQLIRNNFFNLSRLYNITPELIESLNINEMTNILNMIKINNTNLDQLNKSHAHLTFYILSYNYLNKYPDDTYDYFYNIKYLRTINK